MNLTRSFFRTALLLVCALAGTNAIAAPPLPPPTNDASANATVLTHNVGCSGNAAYTTAAATADGSKPSKWGSAVSNNVWFKFQATATTMSVDLKTGNSEGTLRNPRIALLDNSMTELVSQDQNGTIVDIGFSYEGLTIGNWYYIEVDNGTTSGYTGTFTLCLNTTTTYDVPSGAVTLTQNAGCSSNAAYSTSAALGDHTKPATWTDGPNNNVWFKFQATATSVSIDLKTDGTSGGPEGTMRKARLSLHNSSLTEIVSVNENGTNTDVGLSNTSLTVGQWYYINVDNGSGATTDRGTFTICIHDVTSYDYAAGAVVVSHTTSWCSGNAAYTTMIGTPDGTRPSTWTDGPNNNVWFKFQATTTAVSIDLKTDGTTGGPEGTMKHAKMALYNSSFTEIKSVGDNGTSADVGLSYPSLTVGQWYYIMVDNGNGALQGDRGTFTLCVANTVTFDYPQAAVELTSLSNWCSGAAAYSTLNASADGTRPSTWSNGPNANVYFKFTATTAEISVLIKTGGTDGTIRKPKLALLNSAYTELVSVESDNTTNFTNVGFSYNSLTIGSVYYIEVDNAGAASDKGTFALCVNSAVSQDYPAGAVMLTDLNNWTSALAAYTTFIGTADGTRPTIWTYGPSNNVWFKFQAQRPNVTIKVNVGSTEGTLKRPNVALHNSSLTYITGTKDNGSAVDIAITNYTGLTIGNWYYINVDNGNTLAERGTFTLGIDNALEPTTGFTAIGNVGQNELAWTYAGTNQSNFEVQRSTTPGTGYTTLATVGSAIRAYNDVTAVAGTLYYYRVRATNTGGGSPFSAEIPVSTFISGQQSLIWTNVAGATVSGSIVTKTATAGWGNSGAESKNRLADHIDGWISYTVPSITNGEFFFGFNDVNVDNQFYSIAYAFHMSNTAQSYVRMMGTMMYSFNAAAGDVLTIERVGTNINFKQNGTVLYTASGAAINSMIVDAALNTAGAQIAGVSASFGGPASYPITFASLVGVTQTDSITLTKTATSGYGNAGAISASTLPSGQDGWVEFKLDALNKDKTFGFSDNNSDNDETSIDYAFNISSNLVFAYENGVSRGAISGAAVNDVLRVWRIGSNVYWLKNGVIVSTKTGGAITGAMTADVAINTNGAQVVHARSSFYTPVDEGLVPDHVEFLALKALYDNLGGSSWTRKDNWPTGTWPSTATSDEFGTWQNITVIDKDVVAVNMYSNHAVGTIPPALGNLTELTVFSVQSSDFTSDIYQPNNITGTLPTEIGNLTKMVDFMFGGNSITGGIPAGVANMTNLAAFFGDNNQLSGTIPASLFEIPQLESVYLNDNALTGSIPAVDETPLLIVLDLADNQLTGSIPGAIVDCSLLTALYLQHNQLSGTVPSGIADLSELSGIDLSYNSFTGSIPPLGNCTQLTGIDVSHNSFTGSIPDLSGIEYLGYFNAENNQLSGSLDAIFSNYTVYNVDVSNNQFSGPIPDNIAYNDQLATLDLSHNSITGPLPTSIFNLTNCSWFDVSNNQLSGSMPDIGGWRSISYLNLGHNQFTGGVPFSQWVAFNLGELHLENNSFEGVFPTVFAEFANLAYLDMSNNNFTSIPGPSGWHNTWMTLHVDGNMLDFTDLEPLFFFSTSGSAQSYMAVLTLDNQRPVTAPPIYQLNAGGLLQLPMSRPDPGAHGASHWEYQATSSDPWTVVDGIDYDATQQTFQLQGALTTQSGNYKFVQTNDWVPTTITSPVIAVTVVTGQGLIPDYNELQVLKDLYVSTNGDNWTSRTNWPGSTTFPTSVTIAQMATWYGVGVQDGDIVAIGLESNNLSGGLPASLGNLISLQSLVLAHNQITYSLPASIANLSNLIYLDLSYNQIGGYLPSSVAQFSNLQTLLLQHSSLTGTMPADFSTLVNLQTVDLSFNGFYGDLPAVQNSTGLTDLLLNNNYFDYGIPAAYSSLTSLVNLHLENNRLTSIPNEIGQLSGLQSLTIDHNQLTGSIPSTIGDLSALVTLKLDYNQLTGGLPSSMQNLNSLATLSLSNNELEGEIPHEVGYMSNIVEVDFSENNFTGIPLGWANVSVSLHVDGNRLDFNDLESYFIDAGATLCSALTYANQQPLPAPDTVYAAIDGNLRIKKMLDQNPGIHGHMHWEFEDVTWTNVDAVNVDTTQRTFRIDNFASNQAGVYRYTQTNNWIPDLVLVSDTITVIGVTGQGKVVDVYEYDALKDIYDQMGGTSWLDNYGWPTPGNWPASPTSEDFANWAGITVLDNDVVTISLAGNTLTNAIPHSIDNLIELADIIMDYNAITEIPGEIGNLEKLQELSLSANQLTSLPYQLELASSLNQLYLGGNPLSGTIPFWIFYLPNLQYLNLSNTQYSGPIPLDISRNRTLVSLDLSYCQLTGPLPTGIGNVSTLMTLGLDGNPLNTTIVPDIGQLHNLTTLSMSSCGLTGPVPPEIGNLSNLQYMELSYNQLTSLPSTMGDLSSIQWINLTNNNLAGTIPTWFGDLTTLKFLGLANNGFSEIPEEIYSMENLQSLDVSNNQIAGSISPSIQKMKNLSDFSAAGNQLSGSIPSSIGYLRNLQTLYLSNNSLSGPLPDAMSGMTNLAFLILEHNQLSGEIPPGFGDLGNLVDLRVDYNQLSGMIPETLGTPPMLNFIHASNNDFTSVPTTWANQSTIFIDVSGNRIDYAHMEQLFSSPQHFIIGGGLSAYSQKIFETPDEIDVPMGGVLMITAADPGLHTNMFWYYTTGVEGFTPVQLNSVNEDPTQHTLKISNFQASNVGQYYYWEENTWVTFEASQRYSEPIEVKMTNYQQNAIFNPDKLYNGSIAAMRWRTDAPFARGNTDLDGIYLFKYDTKYQLLETQFATPGIGNTYALAGNKMRVDNLSYDPNGNILSMDRFDKDATLIHNFAYTYNSGGHGVQQKNQLESIDSHASYTYNQIGQMTAEDNEEGDDQYVDYDVTGRVVAVYSDQAKSTESLKVTYAYDERGMRIAKVNHQTKRITWYDRDGSGNVRSIFESSVDDNTTNKTEVPIYGASKLGTFYPGTSDQTGIMAYEVTDHLGNVRAIVEDRIIEYKATMEDNGVADVTNPRVSEDYYFKNIWTTAQVDQDMNHTDATPVVEDPKSSAYLYWDDNPATSYHQKGVGPSITLKVGAGDQVSIDTYARYQEETSYAHDFTLTVLGQILGATFVETNGIDNLSTITSLFQNGLGATGVFARGSDDSKPFAYLNYMLFNNSFELQNAGSVRVGENGEFSAGEEMMHNFDHLDLGTISVDVDGYIYVWVSDESKATKVWFDDLKVVHRGAMTTQATDYDPWGIVQRDEKTDQNLIYRYGYQGQFAEKDDETGWNHFELREFDPVVGRWMSMDPRGHGFSPYTGMDNQPTSLTDPDGGKPFTDFVNAKTGERQHIEDGSSDVVTIEDADWGSFMVEFLMTPEAAKVASVPHLSDYGTKYHVDEMLDFEHKHKNPDDFEWGTKLLHKGNDVIPNLSQPRGGWSATQTGLTPSTNLDDRPFELANFHIHYLTAEFLVEGPSPNVDLLNHTGRDIYNVVITPTNIYFYNRKTAIRHGRYETWTPSGVNFSLPRTDNK